MLRAEAAELSLLGSGRRVAEDVEVEGATVLPWPRRWQELSERLLGGRVGGQEG
eukprot:COSAG04_NODE_686_length_11156_cov_44.791806_3_plen_54_part_00